MILDKIKSFDFMDLDNKRIFCFGELLMRFSPALDCNWINDHSMDIFIGGAELNVATALARWEIPVSFGTTLPDNYLSREILMSIEKKGIDISKIYFSGNRIGSYYVPQGKDLKNASVIYDRAYSSFWNLKPGDINWEEVLKDISWFHFSAIVPALNANTAAVCKEGIEVASKMGITISVDLNYREKLWHSSRNPKEIMPNLVQYCNFIMGNIWAYDRMLGIPVAKNLGDDKDAFIENALKSSENLCTQFPKCNQVANTFRFDLKKGINYYAALYVEKKLFLSQDFKTTTIIDKIGSGDTFMAGLIYGNNTALSPQETIDFATAAAFNKLFIKGDATTATIEEIKKYNNYV